MSAHMKTSVRAARREAMIASALATIGEKRSLDLTVAEIAGHAGFSSALAHHYFGNKEDLLIATMQHLLTHMREESALRLRAAEGSFARVMAVIDACFAPWQMRGENVCAWTIFYVRAQSSDAAARLLRIYQRRLHSNLMAGLAPQFDKKEAARHAAILGALIDGAYLREGLKAVGEMPSAHALCQTYVEDLFASLNDSRNNGS